MYPKLYRVKQILFLHTCDGDGKTKKFRKNAVDGEAKLISFSGPGNLINAHLALSVCVCVCVCE